MPGVIEEPAGKRAAQKEERKNQHKARDALRHGPARQRPEEIANAKVFAPGQEKEASAAADVNEAPKRGGKAGLAEEHEENTRVKEEKRGSRAQLSKGDMPSDFLRRV